MANYYGEDLSRIGREAEILVASKLRDRGYCVVPSENRSYDLLCENLRIEVKIAYPSTRGWVWALNNRKNFSESCDVVILVGKEPDVPGFRFFVFPSNHPIFYNHRGGPKAGVGMCLEPISKKCPRPVRRMLTIHCNKWSVISETLAKCSIC